MMKTYIITLTNGSKLTSSFTVRACSEALAVVNAKGTAERLVARTPWTVESIVVRF